MFRWRRRGEVKLEEVRPSLRATAKQPRLRRRPITTESIGSAATHPSLRGALATKQSRGHNMRGASNPDGRTAAHGLLTWGFSRQWLISVFHVVGFDVAWAGFRWAESAVELMEARFSGGSGLSRGE